MSTRKKDPNARLDFGWRWGKWLPAGDYITESTWTIAGPDALLTQESPWVDATTNDTGVWLLGGTVGKTYKVTNRITTNAGRVDDRTFDMKIEQR